MWGGSRDHPPGMNMRILLEYAEMQVGSPRFIWNWNLLSMSRIRRSSSNTSITRGIVKKMCVLCWKEQGPLKDRLQRRLRYCIFFVSVFTAKANPQEPLTQWTREEVWSLPFFSVPWFCWTSGICSGRMSCSVPKDHSRWHYKMCSIAGKWPGDISDSCVLRYLIGDVLLKRISNYMSKTPVGSSGLAKLSLRLHTDFLLEDTRARKKRRQFCEDQCERKLMHGWTCNDHLWEDTVIYIQCTCQAALKTMDTICNT